MNSRLASVLILGSAAVFFLPSGHCGVGFYCQLCSSTQTLEECNATQYIRSRDCEVGVGAGQSPHCIAVVAELTNGTTIGIKDCRHYSTAGCDGSDVCNSENATMPQGARFKRCNASCCDTYDCNQNMFPQLPPTASPEPSSSHVTVMATTTMSTAAFKATVPTAKAAAALTRPYLWLFVSMYMFAKATMTARL